MRRMASGREGSSVSAKMKESSGNSRSSCNRTTICCPFPVGFGPRFFCGITVVDLLIKLCYHNNKPKGRGYFHFGSNRNQTTGVFDMANCYYNESTGKFNRSAIMRDAWARIKVNNNLKQRFAISLSIIWTCAKTEKKP